ncbi:MAG TPA: glycosyltransferase [Candidatus Woesebacteria bacterium]|nr:glycosyltransferase [Candidatus Woesebacteria bacterium]
MDNISIVIPSYQGVALYEKNLPAVLNCMRDQDELIVVDDASGPGDKTVAWFKDKFAIKKVAFDQFAADLYLGEYQQNHKKLSITLLVNHQNQRFGLSANRGFALAKNDLVFLINNDVSPYQDCLEYLIPHFKNKAVFAVACLEHEIATAQIGGRNKLWFEKGIFLHSRHPQMSFGETAWASGGSAMFRKAIFQELKGFDHRYYPAYWEDIDLSFRAKKRGYIVLFEPKAQVNHDHETSNQTVFGAAKIRQISWRNAKKFTWKNGDIWQKISFLLWQPYWLLKMR